jgi:hypothetical protein
LIGRSLLTGGNLGVHSPARLYKAEQSNKKWVAAGPYDLRGITLGVVKKHQSETSIEVVLCAVGLPKLLTIYLSFNLNIAWTCTKQDVYSGLFPTLYPEIPHLLEDKLDEFPEVAPVFCSQATFPRRFSLWKSSILLSVFTTNVVMQKTW